MKTKIKILLVSCVMAAAAVTGFNMAQNSNNLDFSLADISVMAQAEEGESGGSWAPFLKAEYTDNPCTKTVTTQVLIWCPISGSYIFSTETQELTGTWKNCIAGWWICISGCVGAS